MVGSGVAFGGLPGSGAAAVAFVSEPVPALQEGRRVRERVLEPAKRSPTLDRPLKAMRQVRVLYQLDEQFHVTVSSPGPFTVDPQPGLDVIIVAGLLGVEHRLRPHVVGSQIEASATLHGVALQHASKFLKIHRQRIQQRPRSPAERRLDLVRELGITLPATLPKVVNAPAGSRLDVTPPLTDDHANGVTQQLSRGTRPVPPRCQHAHQRVNIRPVDGATQLDTVHTIHHSILKACKLAALTSGESDQCKDACSALR